MDNIQTEPEKHERPDHPFDVVVIHTSEKKISVKCGFRSIVNARIGPS